LRAPDSMTPVLHRLEPDATSASTSAKRVDRLIVCMVSTSSRMRRALVLGPRNNFNLGARCRPTRAFSIDSAV